MMISTPVRSTERQGDRAADVFMADAVVIDHVRRLSADADPHGFVAVNMFVIVEDFLGSRPEACAWWSGGPGATPAINPRRLRYVVDLIHGDDLWSILDERDGLAAAWKQRAEALAAYRAEVAAEVDIDVVLDMFLVMHHQRARGPETWEEDECRALVRLASTERRVVA